MKFFSPMAFWFLILIPVLIFLYILKQRFEERQVPSLYLWHQVLMEAEATSPFQRLKKNILFFIQLFVLLLGIIALANPFLRMKNRDYQNVIIVMDISGSMSGIGEKEVKLIEAKKKAEDLVDSLAYGSKITLITAANRCKVEISNSQNKKEVINKIRDIEDTNSAGNVDDAYSLIRAIADQYDSYKVTYFTDKAVDFKELNAELIYMKSRQDNVSLDYIADTLKDNQLKVLVRATNRGKNHRSSEICLYGEDELISVAEVDLSPGETKTIYFDNVPRDKEYIYAEITEKDGLLEDNIIYSVIKQKDASKILLITEKNIFLEKVFAAMKDIELYKTNPGDIPEDQFDLYIFDGNVPEKLPNEGSLLFINPNKDNKLFKVRSEANGGKVEIVPHGVTKYIENSDFVIAKFRGLQTSYWANSLMTVKDNVIAFVGEHNGQKVGAVGFDFHNSDFPLTTEFPIFINNLISYLVERDSFAITQYECGNPIEINPLPETEKIIVINPIKKVYELSSKFPVKPFEETYTPGIYKVSQKVGDKENIRLLSVNFPISESDISDYSGEVNLKNNSTMSIGGLNLANYLIIAVILLLVLEWIVYLRLYGSRY